MQLEVCHKRTLNLTKVPSYLPRYFIFALLCVICVVQLCNFFILCFEHYLLLHCLSRSSEMNCNFVVNELQLCSQSAALVSFIIVC